MKRFIVIVLDGFGIGYMKDVEKVRPSDLGANTCKHILEKMPDLKLHNLEKLGLINALGEEAGSLKFVEKATFGRAELTHFGADTFMGHQEIMGTKPKMPIKEGFNSVIDKVYDELIRNGYKAEIKKGKEGRFLIVNNCLTIADNIEADLGQAYNVTAALDNMSFEEVLKVGKIVRKNSRVSRVITFGGKEVTIENILHAVEEKNGGFIGINAPKSGVYNVGYQCIHLGYGIDSTVQIPTILGKDGVKVTLLGKVADIVSNEYGKSISCVDTEEVLKLTIDEIKLMARGLICTNVQETDLCGHRQNVEEYSKKLVIADKYLGEIMKILKDDDILLVMADHGNDPTIGHSRHTREMVPLLIFGEKLNKVSIGIRSSLADVGATVAEYFGCDCLGYGDSFLNKIIKS